MQERFESTSIGRAVISVFLLFTIIALIFWNLPDSELKERSLRVVRPYVNATGLNQNWGVFAPNPRRVTWDVYARVEFADGGETIWHVPRGDAVIGSYWDYRWRKWYELWVSDREELRPAAAAYVARLHRDDDRRPVSVTLVRRTSQNLPPGPGPARSEWVENELYTLRIEDR